jgi:putative tricarboxylic transport membrane protein
MGEKHYRIGSIFWLAVGMYTAVSAYQLGFGSFRRPGHGFIFFLASLFLIILSAIDLGGTFIRKPKTEKGKKEEPLWLGVRWGKTLLVLIGIVVYIFIFNFLGFLVSTFLLMVFLFKAVEPTKWWIAMVNSLITILIAYVVFNLWLQVPFPTGALGF